MAIPKSKIIASAGGVLRLGAALALAGFCLGWIGVSSADGQEWLWEGVHGTFDFHYNPVYGTKGVPDAANRPGGRFGASGWADTDGNLYLYGGEGIVYKNGEGRSLLSDLWKYDTSTNEWTWVKGSNTPNEVSVYGTQGTPDPANTPGVRSDAVSWTSADGTFYLFGGYYWTPGPNRGSKNDLWRYDPSTNEWTWLKGSRDIGEAGVYGTLGQADASNTPGARECAVAWTGNDGLLYLFGGMGRDGAGNGGFLNDLWSYDPSTNEWTWSKVPRRCTKSVCTELRVPPLRPILPEPVKRQWHGKATMEICTCSED